MIIDLLRKNNLVYRKAQDSDASGLLTTLISEASMVGKNNGNRESTDEEVLRVIKKFLDNAKETLKLLRENTDIKEKTLREISILESYLPQQLSEDELRLIIKDFKVTQETFNIGILMKYLQANHGGRYDGKLASQIAKE